MEEIALPGLSIRCCHTISQNSELAQLLHHLHIVKSTVKETSDLSQVNVDSGLPF